MAAHKEGNVSQEGGCTASGPGLAGQVARFADFLKGRGFRVFQSSVHDALESLCRIDMLRREDMFAALRANLVSTDLEWRRFQPLFEEFWGPVFQKGPEEVDPHPKRDDPERPGEAAGGKKRREWKAVEGGRPDEEKTTLQGLAYSPVSSVQKKDFGRFDATDIQVAHLALKKMMAPFMLHRSRRVRRSQRAGTMDFARVMRQSLKAEGMPFHLFFRERKKRLRRLVVLADVSGSMDRYARFIMPFILGLRGVGSKAEVFVFSTSLTPITLLLRHLSLEQSLERIAQTVPEWSGGTRIGFSLHQFNTRHGGRLLNRRTVVAIISDGWDLGGKELLGREMADLSRKAHCVIWLNPLAGDPAYQPVCQGMRIAMPYVDYFLPAHSLESLQRVGRLLSRLMVH